MPGRHTLGRIAEALFHRDLAAWLWRRIWLDDIPGRAAALSYYFLLVALFPLLICLSALLGYLFAAETGLQQRLVAYLGSVMPRSAHEIVTLAVDDLLRAKGGAKLSFGLLVALWLASSGMEAAIEGLNVAFQITEFRPWWRRRAVALGLTVTLALSSGCALAVALAGGRIGSHLADIAGVPGVWSPLWRAVQWTASLAFLLFSIALVYYFGPNLGSRRGRQVVMPGALAALAGWIAASAGLRSYLDHFAAIGSSYGSLAAVIALLFWLYLTGAALLLGGEINSGIQPLFNPSAP
jgi:membrane protein